MKIYALTSGEYSDYQVEQITTNKEIAEAYAKIHNCEIEEYDELSDISLIETSKNYNRYAKVYIRPDGVVDEVILKAYIENDNYGFYAKCSDYYIKSGEDEPFVHFNNAVTLYCRADLPYEQIIKVAKDVRSKLLSEKLEL